MLFYEVPQNERDSGETWKPYGDHIGIITHCFCGHVEFPEGDDSQSILEIIQAERKCKTWHKYIPSFDPKEHWNDRRMMLSERLGNKLIIASIILAITAILIAIFSMPPDSLARGWL